MKLRRSGFAGGSLLCLLALFALLPAGSRSAAFLAEAAGKDSRGAAPGTLSNLKVVDSSGEPILKTQILRDGDRIQVSAPGFLPWSGVLQSDEKAPGRIVLLRPGSLRGRALSQGAPLKKFVVGLRGEGIPAPVASSRPASTEGAYRLDLLPPGLHTVFVEAEGFIPIERRVALREGETRWVDFELSRGAWLAARMVGGDGKPLAGAEASIRTEGPDGRFFEEDEKKRLSALRQKSDAKGSVLLGPLARGVRHRIIFRQPDRPARSLILAPSTPLVTREVRLPEGGQIRIRLLDAKRKLIPGATVSLSSDDAADLDLLPESEPSNAEGILKAAPLQAGKYSIRIQARGFLPTTLRDLVVRDGETTDLGEVRLEPGLEISGTVRDEAGSPVVGGAVRARFFEEGRRLSAKDDTDREGRFRISGLPPGSADILTEAKGFFPGGKEKVPTGTPDLELKMTRQGSLSGQVLDDRTGLPATPFTVEWSPESSWGYASWSYWEEKTFADPDGRFRIDGLRPRSYRLRVKARGYKPAVLEGIRVDVQDSSPVEVRVEAGAALRGVVREAETRNPVAGATVRAAELPPVQTDSDGAFTVQGVEGKLRLRVKHPGYLAAEIPEVSSERTDPLEILLSRGGSVEGVVYGGSGDPLPGAEVSASLSEDRPTAVTDGAGRYRLEGLPAGQRVVSKVDIPGTHEGFESQAAEVRSGQTTALDFGVGVSLSGSVTHEGVPASGALLTLAQVPAELPAGSPAMGSRTIRCREDGSYEARGLRAGRYGLMVLWEDRKVGKQIVIPEKTQQVRLDVEIPEIWISGEVLDRQTRLPLRGTVIVSRRTGSDSAGYSSTMSEGEETIEFSSNPQFTGESDAQGRYRIALMEMGTYQVRASVWGYRMDKPVEFEVTSPQSHLEVRLDPAIELTVHAEEASTKRSLEAVCVMLLSESHRETHCGIGEGQFDAMRPGKIRVAVGVPGYAVGTREIELRNEKEEVTVPVKRGGTLRIQLPASVDRDPERILQAARLSIEDSSGAELTALMASLAAGVSWIQFSDTGEAVVTHVSPGRLRVRIGGEGTSITQRQQAVELEEEGEAEVDFR